MMAGSYSRQCTPPPSPPVVRGLRSGANNPPPYHYAPFSSPSPSSYRTGKGGVAPLLPRPSSPQTLQQQAGSPSGQNFALAPPAGALLPPRLPSFLGRQAWERGLGELLKAEANARCLSVSKYGVRLLVPMSRKNNNEEDDSHEANEQSNSSSNMLPSSPERQPQVKWTEDPSLALDMGVISITGKEKEAEEEYLPKGYEGAPPVVLSVQSQVFDGLDDEYTTMMNGLDLVRRGRPPPSRATRKIRIINEAPGPYLIREVLLLPRDEKDANLCVEVEVNGWVYSSRVGGTRDGSVSPMMREEQQQQQLQQNGGGGGEEGHAAAAASSSSFASRDIFLYPGINEASVTVSAAQDMEMTSIKKWIIFRLEGPGVGPAHDMQIHNFVVARKVLASVVDETARNLLNVEARPFVPKYVLYIYRYSLLCWSHSIHGNRKLQVYFDHPCNLIVSIPTKPHHPFQPKAIATSMNALGQYHLPEVVRHACFSYRKTDMHKRDPYK